MSEWVSVKDKPPPEAGDYFVYVNKQVGGLKAFYDGRWFYIQTGLFSTDDSSIEVTHWMPLPEAPHD